MYNLWQQQQQIRHKIEKEWLMYRKIIIIINSPWRISDSGLSKFFMSTLLSVFNELKEFMSKALKGTKEQCLTKYRYQYRDRNYKEESNRSSGIEKYNWNLKKKKKKLIRGTQQQI